MSLGIIAKLTQKIGISAVKAKQVLPTVMTYGGIAGMAVGSFMLAKRMPTVTKIINERKQDIDDVDEEDVRAVMRIRRRTIFEILREVSLPVGIMTLSAAGIIGGHNMIKKEVLGLIGVNSMLEARHSRLFERVKKELGADTADDWDNGITRSEIEYVDENGETQKAMVETTERNDAIFDEIWFTRESSNAFKNSPVLNYAALTSIEEFLTNRLRTKGYITMLEVLEELGMFKMIREHGAVADQILWIMGEGDNEVKFRLERNVGAIKGITEDWVLRPNHDGWGRNRIKWRQSWPVARTTLS